MVEPQTSPLLSVSSASSSSSFSSSGLTTNLNATNANSTRFSGVTSSIDTTTCHMSLQSILHPSNEDPMSGRHNYHQRHHHHHGLTTPPPLSPSPRTSPLLPRHPPTTALPSTFH